MESFGKFIFASIVIFLVICSVILGLMIYDYPKESHSHIEKQLSLKLKCGDIVTHKLTGQKGMVIRREIGYDQVYWYVRWNPSEKPILMSEIEIVLEK